jgi:hypothetical protein
MDCSKSPLIHKHHIIPRYMGGTDGEENLVEVTIAQHAMFHYCNYQMWNNMEDYVAWRGLSGQISEAEFIVEKQKIFGKKGGYVLQEKLKDPEYYALYVENCKKAFDNSPHKEEIIRRAKENQPKMVEAARTPEIIEKKKKIFNEIKHQQGEKNSQYGKMWITDGTKEGTYRINKGESIPEGFRKGRISKNDDNINYYYVITTPEGEIVRTKYLFDYCNRNNLQQTHMYQVVKGKRSHHKGYEVYREHIIT